MSVAYVIRDTDLRSFRRCHRQWDMGAKERQNLEPATSPLALGPAIRAALDVYYFPGMWDWDRAIVLPIVLEAFEKELRDRRDRHESLRGPLSAEADREWEAARSAGGSILSAYFAWAVRVDRFAPIRVATDVDVNIPDPDRPGLELATADGTPVRYRARIDLLAVDAADAYWAVRHRIGPGWRDDASLTSDDGSVGSCWAWELGYVGMDVEGTVLNEIRTDHAHEVADAGTVPRRGLARLRGTVRQHEASGGGRSIPQHRRLYVRSSGDAPSDRIRREEGPGFRRTWIRRTPREIEAVGEAIARDAWTICDPSSDVRPSPSRHHCPTCPYKGPCIAMNEGIDVTRILQSEYRARPAEELEEGRLGGSTWSVGRGAAPPRPGGR